MELREQLSAIVVRLDDQTREFLNTNEEATKTALVLPFFSALGYNIFNPMEFIPEFTADVGIKKGEKVDYAASINGQVQFLVEAKPLGDTLEKHDGQLFRYFSTTTAKFAILTNVMDYWFFTDLEKSNVMDLTPFYKFNLAKMTDADIAEVAKFRRDAFDPDRIFHGAEKLKYLGRIRTVMEAELSSPSEEFTKFVLNQGVHDGPKTAGIIAKCQPLVKQAIDAIVNERLDKRLRHALENAEEAPTPATPEPSEPEPEERPEGDGIVTTEFELRCFYTVQAILSEHIPSPDVAYRDNTQYFNILYQDNRTKWLCRIYEKKNISYVVFPTEDGSKEDYANRIVISSPEDLFNVRDKLQMALSLRK